MRDPISFSPGRFIEANVSRIHHEVKRSITLNPAKALGQEHRLGTLRVGQQADISVLDIKEGDWVVYDVVGGSRKVEKALVPVLTVKKGEVFEAGWGPRPWGWEPDQV